MIEEEFDQDKPAFVAVPYDLWQSIVQTLRMQHARMRTKFDRGFPRSSHVSYDTRLLDGGEKER